MLRRRSAASSTRGRRPARARSPRRCRRHCPRGTRRAVPGAGRSPRCRNLSRHRQGPQKLPRGARHRRISTPARRGAVEVAAGRTGIPGRVLFGATDQGVEVRELAPLGAAGRAPRSGRPRAHGAVCGPATSGAGPGPVLRCSNTSGPLVSPVSSLVSLASGCLLRLLPRQEIGGGVVSRGLGEDLFRVRDSSARPARMRAKSSSTASSIVGSPCTAGVSPVTISATTTSSITPSSTTTASTTTTSATSAAGSTACCSGSGSGGVGGVRTRTPSLGCSSASASAPEGGAGGLGAATACASGADTRNASTAWSMVRCTTSYAPSSRSLALAQLLDLGASRVATAGEIRQHAAGSACASVIS